MRNEWMIRGERVDLGRIKDKLLTVIAEGDHITPPCQSAAIISKVSSQDKELSRCRPIPSWQLQDALVAATIVYAEILSAQGRSFPCVETYFGSVPPWFNGRDNAGKSP